VDTSRDYAGSLSFMSRL